MERTYLHIYIYNSYKWPVRSGYTTGVKNHPWSVVKSMLKAHLVAHPPFENLLQKAFPFRFLEKCPGEPSEQLEVVKSDERIKIWKGDITDKATCSQLIDEAGFPKWRLVRRLVVGHFRAGKFVQRTGVLFGGR